MNKDTEKTNTNEEESKKTITYDEVEDDFYLTQVLGVPINPYQRWGNGFLWTECKRTV